MIDWADVGRFGIEDVRYLYIDVWRSGRPRPECCSPASAIGVGGTSAAKKHQSVGRDSISDLSATRRRTPKGVPNLLVRRAILTSYRSPCEVAQANFGTTTTTSTSGKLSVKCDSFRVRRKTGVGASDAVRYRSPTVCRQHSEVKFPPRGLRARNWER